MPFDFPKKCARVLDDALKYSEDAAFNRFPSSRKEQFERYLAETNFPLRHICGHYEKCPDDVRAICENRVAEFRENLQPLPAAARG